MLTAGGTQ